jgi:hypothetical protein
MTGWRWEDDGAERKRDGYKLRNSSHQRQPSFPFRIDVKQQNVCWSVFGQKKKNAFLFCVFF